MSLRSIRATILWSPLRLLEIPQVGRRLVLLGGHEEAVGAEVIVFRADHDLGVALGAVVLRPLRARARVALESLVGGPRPRERVVEDRDQVMQDVGVGLVEEEALLEYRLVVEVQRQA